MSTSVNTLEHLPTTSFDFDLILYQYAGEENKLTEQDKVNLKAYAEENFAISVLDKKFVKRNGEDHFIICTRHIYWMGNILLFEREEMQLDTCEIGNFDLEQKECLSEDTLRLIVGNFLDEFSHLSATRFFLGIYRQASINSQYTDLYDTNLIRIAQELDELNESKKSTNAERQSLINYIVSAACGPVSDCDFPLEEDGTFRWKSVSGEVSCVYAECENSKEFTVYKWLPSENIVNPMKILKNCEGGELYKSAMKLFSIEEVLENICSSVGLALITDITYACTDCSHKVGKDTVLDDMDALDSRYRQIVKACVDIYLKVGMEEFSGVSRGSLTSLLRSWFDSSAKLYRRHGIVNQIAKDMKRGELRIENYL